MGGGLSEFEGFYVTKRIARYFILSSRNCRGPIEMTVIEQKFSFKIFTRKNELGDLG